METRQDNLHNVIKISTIARECRRRLQECINHEARTDRDQLQMETPQYHDDFAKSKKSLLEEDVDEFDQPNKPRLDPNSKKSHWAVNRLSDFNLWDAGVGASARELNSLDLRLQNDASAKRVVISSLSTLVAWATLCRDLSERCKTHVVAVDQHFSTSNALSHVDGEDNTAGNQDITLEEAKLGVEQLLRNLLNLGAAIRQASAASRLSNADHTLKKHKHEYSSMIEHLTFLLRLSEISREKILLDDRGTTEERIHVSVALQHEMVEHHHPLRIEQQALIDANVKRMHRFEFAKKRRDNLKIPIEEHDSTLDSPLPGKLSRRQSLPARTGEIQYPTKVPKASSTKGVEKLLPPGSQYSIPTTNQLSEFVAEVPLETNVEGTRAPTAIALKADYPTPPKPSSDATGLVCPYCSLTLLSETARVTQWRKHVSEDLQPYTCYLPNCQHNRLFNTFKAWKTHVFSEHQIFRGWTCFFCQQSRHFAEEGAFNEHIQVFHQDAVAEEYLSDLSTACEIYDEPTLDICPVCSMHEDGWNMKRAIDVQFELEADSFLDHIGKCLHNFALRALPLSGSDRSVGVTNTGGSGFDSRSDLSGSLAISISGKDRRDLTRNNLPDAVQQAPDENVKAWLSSMVNNSLFDDADDEGKLSMFKISSFGNSDNDHYLLHGVQKPLLKAAKNGDETVLKLLIENDAQLEIKDIKTGQTPLSWAARNGHEAIVKLLLLTKAVQLESVDENGRTSLSWAARNEHEAIVRLLLNEGAKLETGSKNGRTPLLRAVENGHEGIVRLLLEKGAECATKDKNGQTPLSWAARNGYEVIVILLLEKGVELEIKDHKYGQTPLSWAVENNHQLVVKILLEKGAELESKDKHGQTPLSWAARNGHEEIIELLLERGAELETKSNNGRTPLLRAARNGHEAVVELLLKRGAEVEITDANGQTPLSWAARNGHDGVVKLLIDSDAERNTKDENGETPLMKASRHGHDAVVKLLALH